MPLCSDLYEPKVGDRVSLRSTPIRGIIGQRIDDVVLVHREDSDRPVMTKIDDVQLLYDIAERNRP